MKNLTCERKKLLKLGLVLVVSTLLHACGQARQDDGLTAAGENAKQQPPGPTGGFNLSCGKQLPQQYKQAEYQQQQHCVAQGGGKKGQSFAFKDSRVSDFELSLDCAKRVVVAQSKTVAGQLTSIPIAADGSVKGNLNYPQQVLNDGYGTDPCYVQLAVAFDGTARCDEPNGKAALALNTEVSFLESSLGASNPGSDVVASLPEESPNQPRRPDVDPGTGSEIPGRDNRNRDRGRDGNGGWGSGGAGDGDQYPGYPQPVPGPVPAPVPGPVPVPGPEPVPVPVPGPGQLPSQGPGPIPAPIPGGPAIPPRKGCVVRNPCPIVTKTDLSCPE